MDLLNLPMIEVYQEGKKWRWRIMHSHAKELIGESVQKFHTKTDCIKDLQDIARLINAWTVAVEQIKPG